MKVSKLNTAWVLARRELRSTIYGIGIYLTVFITLIVASFILRGYLLSVSEVRYLITSTPLTQPFSISVIVGAVYLALASATSIAREKDQRTIEVLFYGPVDYISYVFSKYLKGILSYLVIALFLIVYFLLASVVTNLGLSLKFFQGLVLSFFLVSCIIGFGILLSTLTSTVRSAVLLLLAFVLVLLGIQVAGAVLLSIGSAASRPLTLLRDSLSIINGGLRWISPLAYFREGLDAIAIESSTRYLISLVSSLIYSVVLLVLSIFILRRRGVRTG